MRYTVPMVVERVLELLNVQPLLLQYASECEIAGFSLTRGEWRRSDVLWVQDNSGGSRPYAPFGARHCLYIASRAEEDRGLPACGADRSLAVLPHTVRPGQLAAALEQCFRFYNVWSDDLLDIVRRGGDGFALLEAGHRVLRNQMVLYNRSMRIMAYTADDGTDDDMWVDTVRAGVARVDSPRKSADLMRFLAEVERHDGPFRFEGEGMSEPFWCAPVRMDGRTFGMVNVVEHHRALALGDRDLLRYFAGFAAVALQRPDAGAAVPDDVHRQFMRDLLNGDIASRDLLNARLIAVDWRVQDCLCFVSLRSPLPFLSGEQWRAHREQLAALGLNALLCRIDRDGPHLGLVLTAAGPERLTPALQIIDGFCAMNALRAGISDAYGDLLDTPRFYRQAEVALELGDGALCRYEQARYPRMLRHLRSHPFRQDLLHPAVARLAALDGAEGTEYIRTLQALIRHAFNQLETADALGIHRTTLAYRLRRMQELTSLRLSDPDQMFHVAVSLKLMREP